MKNTTSKQILCIDSNYASYRSLVRLQSVLHIRDGIFCPINRIMHQHPKAKILFYHPQPEYKKYICKKYNWQNVDALNNNISAEIRHTSKELHLFQQMNQLSHQIEKDLVVWLKTQQEQLHSTQTLRQFTTNATNLYIHQSVDLSSGVHWITEEGPIVIEKNVKIAPFSILQGPLFIGANSQLSNIRVDHSIIGTSCRLSGEISHCLIGDFTNKQHDGFIGHSLIGEWVNLAAATNISDLKNTYSNVQLSIQPKSPKFLDERIDTGELKFGAVIGDWCKTAIGTMIQCGSNLDIASHLFADTPLQVNGYWLPFSWGKNGKYDKNKFMKTAMVMAARRSQILSKNWSAFIHALDCERL